MIFSVLPCLLEHQCTFSNRMCTWFGTPCEAIADGFLQRILECSQHARTCSLIKEGHLFTPALLELKSLSVFGGLVTVSLCGDNM